MDLLNHPHILIVQAYVLTSDRDDNAIEKWQDQWNLTSILRGGFVSFMGEENTNKLVVTFGPIWRNESNTIHDTLFIHYYYYYYILFMNPLFKKRKTKEVKTVTKRITFL